MRSWQSGPRRLLLATLLAVLGLSAVGMSPLIATTSSAQAGQPPSPPSTPPGLAKLEASDAEVPAGRSVRLTARLDQPEPGPVVIAIRHEAGHLESGLAASCWSQPTCTVDVQADHPTTRTYAVAVYRCDAQGVCLLAQDAAPSEKVRVVWH